MNEEQLLKQVEDVIRDNDNWEDDTYHTLSLDEIEWLYW